MPFQKCDISPEIILNAYRHGVFPMADSAQDIDFEFYAPVKRGLLPIKDLHIPKRLLRTLKQAPFEVRINSAFREVITACAKPSSTRKNTWINDAIRGVFCELHAMGHAHSVECWQNNQLVGGLYGLHLGRIFCGESMFSIKDDASKIALIHLCARLHMGGFTTLDAQFHNPHLEQFGLYEIPQATYLEIIEKDKDGNTDFILADKTNSEILKNYLQIRGL